MTSARRVCVVAWSVLCLSAPVLAQEPVDPFETARFRWGPIRFTPVLEITSVGHDSNVFNEFEDPKSDFTAAVGPAVKLWMRPARTNFSLSTGAQYLYFRKYDDQRAWNADHEAKWEIPLARLTPFVAGTYVNSRDRLGYEIDARSRRRDQSYTVGATLRVSGKTQLVGSHQRSQFRYDERESSFGAELATALNRRTAESTVQFRYALTPLTTFVTTVDVGRDRFDVDHVRDSDHLTVLPGFELKPFALISGTIFVGFRQFDPLDNRLPDYRGVVAAVKAKYRFSATQVEAAVDRDVAYSFEETLPYYALLDYGLTVTQRVTQRWDLVGEARLQQLAYRSLALEPSPIVTPPQSAAGAAERLDRGRVFAGGLGWRLNETTRLGLNVSHARRISSAERRSFEGTRVFGSITYGTQQ